MAEFNTNPGDRSVSELERDVDSERERVSATIDELQARASMGNIVDQVVKAVGENGGEVSRNLGRSLRDNPIAALLTGVGVAWLMAGSNGSASKGSDWNSDDPRYRGGTEPDWRTFGVARDPSDFGSQRDPSGFGSQSGSSMTDEDPSSPGLRRSRRGRDRQDRGQGFRRRGRLARPGIGLHPCGGRPGRSGRSRDA